MEKLDIAFYDRDAIVVAKELLGKRIVHQQKGHIVSARIVEVEAYMGIGDQASHAYNGRRTPRVEVMYGDPGFAYVFSIYGLHSCFNVVSNKKGNPQAVLIRAVEPVQGIEFMAMNRFEKSLDQLSQRQIVHLTNGPGKLCKALGIHIEANGINLQGDEIYLVDDAWNDFNMVSTKRVGIDYAGEAKDYLWRFYIQDNQYVSVK